MQGGTNSNQSCDKEVLFSELINVRNYIIISCYLEILKRDSLG